LSAGITRGFFQAIFPTCTRALLAVTVLISFSYPSHADLAFHWQDRFTTTEQQKIQLWLNETHQALEVLVGELPFTTHLYLHRTSAREPVPWANTERSKRQGVHFHVDPDFSLQEFRNDWTAPHELSHLVLPYVGRSNSWFAEGFASYMQYQVMHQMGVLSQTAMRKRYEKNLTKAAGRYAHANTPFARAAQRLRAERNYATMYWGGAAFFLQADELLKQNNKPGLVAVLRDYVSCCRLRKHSMTEVVTTLDQLGKAGDKNRYLAALLHQYRTRPGFPRLELTQ